MQALRDTAFLPPEAVTAAAKAGGESPLIWQHSDFQHPFTIGDLPIQPGALLQACFAHDLCRDRHLVLSSNRSYHGINIILESNTVKSKNVYLISVALDAPT
jgi:hypothetical protein